MPNKPEVYIRKLKEQLTECHKRMSGMEKEIARLKKIVKEGVLKDGTESKTGTGKLPDRNSNACGGAKRSSGRKPKTPKNR